MPKRMSQTTAARKASARSSNRGGSDCRKGDIGRQVSVFALMRVWERENRGIKNPAYSGPAGRYGHSGAAGRSEMFRCERCGSGFSPIRVTSGDSCPRCRARDGVWAQLTFAPFYPATSEADDAPHPVGRPNDEVVENDEAVEQEE